MWRQLNFTACLHCCPPPFPDGGHWSQRLLPKKSGKRNEERRPLLLSRRRHLRDFPPFFSFPPQKIRGSGKGRKNCFFSFPVLSLACRQLQREPSSSLKKAFVEATAVLFFSFFNNIWEEQAGNTMIDKNAARGYVRSR